MADNNKITRTSGDSDSAFVSSQLDNTGSGGDVEQSEQQHQVEANSSRSSCVSSTTTTKTPTIDSTTTAGGDSCGSGQTPICDEHNIDAEYERLLRKTKRQVKQMMEEAVTKKFIHEESSSIISLCVAIDACISHGLERRALGLFKTNSSTALIQKVAKSFPIARDVLALVEEEEKIKLERQQKQQQQRKQSIGYAEQEQQQRQNYISRHPYFVAHNQQNSVSAPIKQASNHSVHKRNMWIKFALMEKKLVDIVEYLAKNANKFYEPGALMANYLSSQLLCSLLVGPCALEFSRSKTHDYYQFEEPTADELLKRHKLSNPISCLCSSSSTSSATGHHYSSYQQPSVIKRQQHHHHQQQQQQPKQHLDDQHNQQQTNSPINEIQHNQLARSATDGNASACLQKNADAAAASCHQKAASVELACQRSRSATIGQAQQLTKWAQKENDCCSNKSHQSSRYFGSERRRRPLALKTNVKTGALVTDCHHYSCQEISEHHQTRGYSFKCNDFNYWSPPIHNNNNNNNSTTFAQNSPTATTDGSGHNLSMGIQQTAANQQQQLAISNCISQQQQQQQQSCWSVWSPRMLHETLHQNSKSSLLYAKNNVLMETQSQETLPGYLSLHQMSNDLILKWIPNQMINGHAPNGGSLSSLPSDNSSQTDNNNDHDDDDHHGHQDRSCCCAKTTKKCSSLGASRDELITNRCSNFGAVPGDHGDDKCASQRQPFDHTNQPGQDYNKSSSNRDLSPVLSCGNNQSLKQRTSSANNDFNLVQSVASSYLDLVVNLSLSRIVLLHCQFNAPNCNNNQQQSISNKRNAKCEPPKSDHTKDTNDGNDNDQQPKDQIQLYSEQGGAIEPENKTNEISETTTSEEATPQADDNPPSTSSSAFVEIEPVANEETLTLVEVDGVRRAPFKFPKGGLRWFLSCLEGGLRPNRYLEPAIRPYDCHLDPLAPEFCLASGSDSPSTISEPASTSASAGGSRLDGILRRLSSLKHRNHQTPTTDHHHHHYHQPTSTLSRASSPTPSLEQQTTFVAKAPLNYVYQIVSIQQQQATDWRLQTPPNSALSVASSSSGSFALGGGGGGVVVASGKQHASVATTLASEQQYQNDLSSSSGSQILRWSFSRFTRFSSRYTATTSSASTSASAGASNASFPSGSGQQHCGDITSSLSHQQHPTSGTLESYTSFAELANGMPLDNPHPIDDCCATAVTGPSASNAIDNNESDRINSAQIERDNSREFVRVEAKLNDLRKSSSDELMALRNQSIQTLCESMRRQILARAFYGWLAYCRRTKIIQTHLIKLINTDCRLLETSSNSTTTTTNQADDDLLLLEEAKLGLTRAKWNELINGINQQQQQRRDEAELAQLVNFFVYYGGIESDELRAEVWPFLLGQFNYCDDEDTRQAKDKSTRETYETCRREWIQIEKVVKQRDSEILAANMARIAERRAAGSGGGEDATTKSAAKSSDTPPSLPRPPTSHDVDYSKSSEAKVVEQKDSNINNNDEQGSFSKVVEENEREGGGGGEDSKDDGLQVTKEFDQHDISSASTTTGIGGGGGGVDSKTKEQQPSKILQVKEIEVDEQFGDSKNELNSQQQQAGDRGKQTRTRRKSLVEFSGQGVKLVAATNNNNNNDNNNKRPNKRRVRLESTGSVGSDASITDQFGNNIHRIDKDVQRCDRNFWYFKELKNLDKLRNVMYSYVWQHLDVGYVQGMCDLAAPLLVISDDEFLAYTWFERLMTRMVANFPHGNAMDQHFESLKYLMQVLDPKLFEVLQNNGDYTHFYFCYRWLLLDFKRELVYEDVYRVWETIWSARHIATEHFVVFMALAMVRYYRDIIIENNMDFTDTIKFFNEMAERHDAKKIIALARDSVIELDSLIRA